MNASIRFTGLLALAVLLASCSQRYAQRYGEEDPDGGVYATRSGPGKAPDAGLTPNTTNTRPRNDGTVTDPRISESSGTSNTTNSSASSRARSRRADVVIQEARTYLGTPYRYGGEARNGIDCSALMCAAFRKEGIQLPRTSRDQSRQGRSISLSQVQPGDMLFFWSSQRGVVGHAGLVVSHEGDKVKFIHAAVSGGVRIDQLQGNSYWTAHFMFARRVID